LISAVAAVIPGAHADDNAALESGKLIETTAGTTTDGIELDVSAVTVLVPLALVAW
jgi:hypothetical protein